MRIVVKSISSNFDKEKSDLKNNTIRSLDGNDIIEVVNAETGESFKRVLRDVSVWYDQLIFTWEPIKVVSDKVMMFPAACSVCGCTDDKACPGGCFWVKPGLCSACAAKTKATSINLCDGGKARQIMKEETRDDAPKSSPVFKSKGRGFPLDYVGLAKQFTDEFRRGDVKSFANFCFKNNIKGGIRCKLNKAITTSFPVVEQDDKKKLQSKTISEICVLASKIYDKNKESWHEARARAVEMLHNGTVPKEFSKKKSYFDKLNKRSMVDVSKDSAYMLKVSQVEVKSDVKRSCIYCGDKVDSDNDLCDKCVSALQQHGKVNG